MREGKSMKVVYQRAAPHSYTAVPGGQQPISPRGMKSERSPIRMPNQPQQLNEDLSTLMSSQQNGQHLKNLSPRHQNTSKPIKPHKPVAFDLKEFRLVASDFLMSSVLQNLFAKLWKLMVSFNYEKEAIRQNHEMLLQIPLRIEVYEAFEPLFIKGLGALYQTSDFISCRTTNHSSTHVLFQRFCFDFLSMSGSFIYQLTINQYEYLLRRCFSLLTYYDTLRSELCFRRLEDVGTPQCTGQPQHVITRQLLTDIMTTQWSQRKDQIKSEYEAGRVNEMETQNLIKRQLDSVEETDETGANQEANATANKKSSATGAGEYMNLINLTAIADKAREEKQRRMEQARLKREERKLRPIPFYIDWVLKEDLDTVLKTQMAKLSDPQDTQQDKQDQLIITANNHTRLPTSLSQERQPTALSLTTPKGHQQFSGTGYVNPFHMPDQTLKQVIMFKQFTKLGAKPKEGALDSDEEFEKIREEKERGRREEAERRARMVPVRPLTPVLVDSDSDNNMRKVQNQEMIVEEGAYEQMISNEISPLSEGSPPGGETPIPPGDDAFVKFVWNKKTKRLDRRDLRLTANLKTNEEKHKFEKFVKVNEKSKILSMQLHENYFNSAIVPQAIAGDGDVNFKEIQEQQLYAPNDLKAKHGHHLPLDVPLPSYQINNPGKSSALSQGSGHRRRHTTQVTQQKQSDSRLGSNPFSRGIGLEQSADYSQQQQNSLVDKKLAQIRNALRGEGAFQAAHEINYDEYLTLFTNQKAQDFRQAAAVAQAFNDNQQQLSTNRDSQQQTRGMPGGQMLETRDIMHRSHLLSLQKNNKQTKLNQREQLKSSMHMTSKVQPDLFKLPILDGMPAPVVQKISTKNATTSFGTTKVMQTPNSLLGQTFFPRPIKTSLQKVPNAQTVAARGVAPSSKGFTAPSPPNRGSQGKTSSHGFQQHSPRSSNNNMGGEQHDYGVLTLNKDLIRIQNQKYYNTQSTIEEDGTNNYMILTERSPPHPMNQRDLLNESSVEEEDLAGGGAESPQAQLRQGDAKNANIAVIDSKEGERHRPTISPLDLSQLVKNRDGRREHTKSEDPVHKLQSRVTRFNNDTQQTSRRAGDFSATSKYSQLNVFARLQKDSLMRNTNYSSLDKQTPYSILSTKEKPMGAYINQLPMQDFQLEQWRSAYKNINAATRHFYTGSSYAQAQNILKI